MEPPPVSIFVRSRVFDVNGRIVAKIAQICLSALDVANRDVSINLVNSAEIRDLNREYRGKDKTTDVLSFPQEEFAEPIMPGRRQRRRVSSRWNELEPLGDIVISLPQAASNARDIGQGLDREVAFLIVHGLLHLCGHDHLRKSDERVMLIAQRYLMSLLESGKRPIWQGCVTRRSRVIFR